MDAWAYLVLGRHMHDAVGVDIEGDLHLGHTTGGGGQADQVELPQGSIICRHLTLPLEHLDAHLRLVVRGCAEDLRLLCGDGGVPASILISLAS